MLLTVGVKLLGLLLCCSLPLKRLTLTSPFGYRLHPIDHRLRLHAGVDLKANADTVYSILPGLTAACCFNTRLGLYLRIAHGCELQSTYGHLSQWFVQPGDSVQAGQAIGLSGATGIVTGAHLHFALSFKNKYIDPLAFLRRMVIPDTLQNKMNDEQTKQ